MAFVKDYQQAGPGGNSTRFANSSGVHWKDNFNPATNNSKVQNVLKGIKVGTFCIVLLQ